MAKIVHVWEEVPDELETWMQESVDYLYDEITSGGKSIPFAADTSEKDDLDYYRSRFFNADGTHNDQGRAEEYQRVGPNGYTRIIQALAHQAKGTEDPNFITEMKSYTPGNEKY